MLNVCRGSASPAPPRTVVQRTSSTGVAGRSRGRRRRRECRLRRSVEARREGASHQGLGRVAKIAGRARALRRTARSRPSRTRARRCSPSVCSGTRWPGRGPSALRRTLDAKLAQRFARRGACPTAAREHVSSTRPPRSRSPSSSRPASRRPTRRSRARRPPSRPGAPSRPPTALGCCAGSRRSSRSTHEELARIESRQRRQADRRRTRRGRHGRAGLPLLRRRGRQALRRDDPGRRRRRPDVPRAARRRRPDRALELPAQHRELEARPGARVRQHRRAQAGRADAALGAAARASSRSRPASPRASSTSSSARARSSASGSSSTRTSRRSASPARPRSGRAVMEGAAATIKRVTLELGGKSANVVFADADLERAAAAAPYAVFDNAGQDCCARSRILVERSVYDRFLELLVDATAARAGRRSRADEATEMGPLISAAHRETVASLRRRRRRSSAARRRTGTGFWFPCTLVEATNDDRDRARGGVRPGRGGDPVRRRGRRDPPSPTTRRTASRARSGRETARARCASPARSRPACSRSTRTRRCACSTPFGGFKQSGFGRELGHAGARRLLGGQERLHRDGGWRWAGSTARSR